MRGFLSLLSLFLLLTIEAQAQMGKVEFEKYLAYHPYGDSLLSQTTNQGNTVKQTDKNCLPNVPVSEGQTIHTWRAIARWNVKDVIVTLGVSEYHQPIDETLPYAEYWLISFDKGGNIIDYCMIGKEGELYACNIEGKVSSTLELIAYRATMTPLAKEAMPESTSYAQINLQRVRMDKAGRFSEQYICNTSGQITQEGKRTRFNIAPMLNIKQWRCV